MAQRKYLGERRGFSLMKIINRMVGVLTIFFVFFISPEGFSQENNKELIKNLELIESKMSNIKTLEAEFLLK